MAQFTSRGGIVILSIILNVILSVIFGTICVLLARRLFGAVSIKPLKDFFLRIGCQSGPLIGNQ